MSIILFKALFVSNPLHDPKDAAYLFAIQKMREGANLIRQRSLNEIPDEDDEEPRPPWKERFHGLLTKTSVCLKSLLEWAVASVAFFGAVCGLLWLLVEFLRPIFRLFVVRRASSLLDFVEKHYGFIAGGMLAVGYVFVFGSVLAIVGPLFVKLCRKVFSLVPAPSFLFEHHIQLRIEILISFGMACVLLSAALGHWFYQNYVYLRYLVCLIAAFLAMRAHEFKRGAWAWGMVSVAALFNPILPLRLARLHWQLLDLGAAVALVAWAWIFRYPQTGEREFLEPFAAPDRERPDAEG
jgi:hypothetical protein